MISKFVYMVVLLAWGPDVVGTSDSGRFADLTLSDCHARTQTFSTKHGTPIQLCQRITKKSWQIISTTEIVFDFTGNNDTVVIPDNNDEEVKRLRAALKAIGRWHVGKTKDSQRVRAIIRKATK